MSDWAALTEAMYPAIPSAQYLEKDLGGGSEALPGAVTTALASALYRLKNGSSVAINMPVLNPGILKSTLYYLHRCRIDALHGLIRANWLNSYSMCMAPDLLVWSRTSMQVRLLRDAPGLNLRHVGLNRETRGLKHDLEEDDRIARTILCQAGDDLSVFCSELKAVISPFMIVVDMTPFGYREDPQHIAELMEDYFPGVPMLMIGCTGDLQTDKAFSALPRRFPLWRQHVLDKTPIAGKKTRLAWSPALVTAPDQRLSDRLYNAVTLCKKCHELVPQNMRKDSSGILYRILNSLQTLSVPIEFYEAQLSSRRHGGLFPIKPLKDWLSLARRAKLPTGEAQNALRDAADALEEILGFIAGGLTGKAQALSKWIEETIRSDKSGLVVVNSARDAAIMRSWLVQENARDFDRGKLAVLGARSVRDTYKLLDRYDRAIVTGKLWDSDLWALFSAKEVTWLIYESESYWIGRLAAMAMFAGSASTDGKEDWWWLKGQKTPPAITTDTEMPAETWGDCSGQYLIEKAFNVELSEDPVWMAKLFEEIEEPEEIVRPDSPMSPGEVSITTESDFYRFDCNAIVQVFTESGGEPKVEDVEARDLKKGMRLILLNGEDHGMFSVMEMLIDFVTGNSKEEQMYQHFSARWFDYVDGAVYRNGGVEQLQRKLKKEGVDIGVSTVRRWVNHIGIAPQYKSTVVPAMARISGIQFTNADLSLVQKSQSKVLGLHSRVGKAVKAAMMAEVEGATEVTIFGKKTVPLEMLRAQYSIEEVQMVTAYEEEAVAEDVLDLPGLLQSMADNSDGRIVITPRGLKSAGDSPYKNLEKVKMCFSLLINDYFPVWANGTPLEPAKDKGLPYGIQFTPNTSDKTKGKYKSQYYPLYKGQKVDIGRHLGIGDAWNPERCFRVHFHFDEANRQIVVHHAGRHLSTATTG